MRWLRRHRGVRNLQPLAVEQVTKPTDLFKCVWYRATLSAACCLARQQSAKRAESRSRKEKLHGVGLAAICKCMACPIGDMIAEQVRKPKAAPVVSKVTKRQRRKKKRHARARR